MVESLQNYRRLGRNGSGLAYCSKSSSAFFLLLLIAFIFSLVYLYFNTNSELQSFRIDFESLNSKQLNLKNELLDANVKVEELTKSESECKANKDKIDAELQVCKKELFDKNTSLGQVETNKVDCENMLKELRSKLDSTNSALKARESENNDKASIIANMTLTIEQLRNKLASTNILPSGKPDLASNNVLLETSGQQKDITITDGKGSPREQIVAPAKVDDIAVKEDAANEKQSGDVPKRHPGGRVHLAEQEEKREKLSNHKDLLHAAANLDKQQEVLDDAGPENGAEDSDNKVIEPKNKKNKNEKSVNRPLVDALHGIVA